MIVVLLGVGALRQGHPLALAPQIRPVPVAPKIHLRSGSQDALMRRRSRAITYASGDVIQAPLGRPGPGGLSRHSLDMSVQSAGERAKQLPVLMSAEGQKLTQGLRYAMSAKCHKRTLLSLHSPCSKRSPTVRFNFLLAPKRARSDPVIENADLACGPSRP